MNHAFENLFKDSYRHIAITGSDLPVLPARFLTKTFDVLQTFETDVVLGPNDDGGCYLVGVSRPSIADSVEALVHKLELPPEIVPFACLISRLCFPSGLSIHSQLAPWFSFPGGVIVHGWPSMAIKA